MPRKPRGKAGVPGPAVALVPHRSGQRRYTVRTEAARASILTTLADGETLSVATAVAGMSLDTLRVWRDEDADLDQEIINAQTLGHRQITDAIKLLGKSAEDERVRLQALVHLDRHGSAALAVRRAEARAERDSVKQTEPEDPKDTMRWLVEVLLGFFPEMATLAQVRAAIEAGAEEVVPEPKDVTPRLRLPTVERGDGPNQ